MRANLVGNSVVSAITQTPASGPLGPRTTPPISSASIATVAGAVPWAPSSTGAANSAAKPIAATVLRNCAVLFIRLLLSLQNADGRSTDRPARRVTPHLLLTCVAE